MIVPLSILICVICIFSLCFLGQLSYALCLPPHIKSHFPEFPSLFVSGSGLGAREINISYGRQKEGSDQLRCRRAGRGWHIVVSLGAHLIGGGSSQACRSSSSCWDTSFSLSESRSGVYAAPQQDHQPIT